MKLRNLVVLTGTHEWCRNSAAVLISEFEAECRLWLAAGAPAGHACIDIGAAVSRLGGELDALVYDCYSGFDPDALGAAAGLVCGGGVLIMLLPPLAEWPEYAAGHYGDISVYGYEQAESGANFFHRFIGLLDGAAGVQVIGEPEVVSPLTPPAPVRDDAFGSTDQARAVAEIVHVVRGHRRRPLVLTSDRGRGKSSALGIAAARLLRDGVARILVTAPRRAAAGQVFEHAARALPEAHVTDTSVSLGDGCYIRFIAPDALCLEQPEADLLLVDEAAAIPVQMLEQMLTHYPRLVYASTVHGYEGTGRGFALRFHKVLDKKAPGWHPLALTTPIRWPENDPLEAFIDKALVLSADAAPAEALADLPQPLPEGAFEKISGQQLAAEPQLLNDLFGLLVLAHYRTRPTDLWHLLDSPNMEVYALRHRGRVLATALLAKEGGFDERLAEAVYMGERRPRGHLLPQSLAVHAGIRRGACYRYARVVRIAVHPSLQRGGIGSAFVQRLIGHCRGEGLDAVGAGFASDAELLPFWLKNGFRIGRVGVSREHTSGAFPLIVLKGLNGDGEALAAEAGVRFSAALADFLAGPLKQMEPELAWQLLSQTAPKHMPLSDYEQSDVESFARGKRGYEYCLPALRRWLLLHGPQMSGLTDGQKALLLMKLLQGREWADVAAYSGLAGRKAAVAALRELVAAQLGA